MTRVWLVRVDLPEGDHHYDFVRGEREPLGETYPADVPEEVLTRWEQAQAAMIAASREMRARFAAAEAEAEVEAEREAAAEQARWAALDVADTTAEEARDRAEGPREWVLANRYAERSAGLGLSSLTAQAVIGVTVHRVTCSKTRDPLDPKGVWDRVVRKPEAVAALRDPRARACKLCCSTLTGTEEES